jgi:hypothetical protein
MYVPTRYPPVVCTMPLGLPVVPDVYRMYSGCSLSSGSGRHAGEAIDIISCHQWSRPGCMRISWPVRR